MDELPSYPAPLAFLEALAKRLHTVPDRVPSARATEELLHWLEERAATGQPSPSAFLQVAARLLYEQTRLVLGPTQDEVSALATRLTEQNQKRAQAAQWRPADWRKLARLVLENRRLPLVELFGDQPPTPTQVIEQIELPFAARHVEDPLAPEARRLPGAPLSALFDRAEQLLLTVAVEANQARSLLPPLRAALSKVPRRPPFA